jgi:UPF0755 protein
MKGNMDFRAWEYVVYFFVTTFLLLTGVFLLLLGFLYAVTKRVAGGRHTAARFTGLGLLLLFAVAGYLRYQFVADLDLGSREVTILVQSGDRFTNLAARLQTEGVVRSRWLLEYAARWTDIDKRLLPGAYRFTGKNSCHSILEKIRQADRLQTKITVIEGATIWRVAGLLAQQLRLDSTELIALNRDAAFLDSLGLPCLEGYLFPETYLFPPGISTRAAVREMVAMFHHKTDSLWTRPPMGGLNKAQAVIMASIVQAETGILTEAPVVASVYHNRLQRGMLLDADPTVIYGLGGLDRPLTKDDLEKATPYNTYRLPGLPPTPINSPGLPALAAAIRPDSTGYLYFVADGQGGHRFSYTNEEHNTMRKRLKMASRRN